MSTKVVSIRPSPEPLFDLNSPGAERRIADLSEQIVTAYVRGKFPLFLLGAGVSSDAGVPMMTDMLAHLLALVSNKKKTALNATEKSLTELSNYCDQARLTRNRSDMSVLFGALQESSFALNRSIWNDFCKDFISCRIETKRKPSLAPQSIWDLNPTPCHSWVADMCVDLKARCVSLNFDGLTRKALDIRLQRTEAKAKAVILDSSQKIRRFYGRPPEDDDDTRLHDVIKLRGDIFYAICQTPGCPLERERIPIYDLPKIRSLPDAGAENPLRCPECYSDRELQVSFPGYHLKELESEEILSDLWRFVVPSTSALIVMGFSGEWDQSAVAFLFKVAQSQRIPIADIRLRPEPRMNHNLWEVCRTKYGAAQDYFALYGTCDAFAELMTKNVPLSAEHPAKELAKLEVVPVPADDIWEFDEKQDPHISAHLSRVHDVEQLRYYSQLGLKTYWWGVIKKFARHNRYLHSIGAMRVADKWYDVLRKQLSLHHRARSKDVESELLRISMLLHDYGHLPFSHLCEEIFDELNWLPSVEPHRPWHEVLTKEKIDSLIKCTLPDGSVVSEYLQRAGLVEEDVLNLIEGASGKPYLDAIVNSPIDADKIDYIFRDLTFLSKFQDPKYSRPGSISTLDPHSWLDEFLSKQQISPEGYIRLNGRSALRALELLEARRSLYLDFYFAPELRVLERIAAFVIINYLTHFLATDLRKIIEERKEFKYDHGEYKAHLAAERIVRKYLDYLREGGTEFQEGLLLRGWLNEILERDNEVNGVVIEVLTAIKQVLNRFSDGKEDLHLGQRLHEVYDELLIAGPYYSHEANERALREVVRELMLLNQGTVLFDVVKTPKFLGSASARDFSAFWRTSNVSEPSVAGEVYFVPSDNPSDWRVNSSARVPLSAVKFGTLGRRYLQVVVFDPLGRARAKGRFVDQQFNRMCSARNVRLVDNPGRLGGND